MGTAVVIVEDSEQFVLRLKAAVNEVPGLALAGSAATPAEAIELVFTARPAIVILDLFLIGGSGVEVLRAIKEQRLDTQVIVVTNAPSKALSDSCRDLGARFFFDKALEFDQFQEVLRTLPARSASIQAR